MSCTVTSIVDRRALPSLLIIDIDGSMGGRTLTIADVNGLYTHTVTFPQGESTLSVLIECLGQWTVTYTNASQISMVRRVDVVSAGGTPVTTSAAKIVTWASGTDSEIAQMVAAADAGIINLADYWNVGDERQVALSAMTATGVGESHAAQTAVFTLMNSGGKTLSAPTASGRTTCSFVVGLKDCLKEKGYMNSSSSNVGGWTSCRRRTWCNSVFKKSLPQNLLPIFKQFENKTSAGDQSTTINTDVDWFALPSEIEVFGSTPNSAPGEGTQFTWYETGANLIKKVNGSAYEWWERSPWINSSMYFCRVDRDSSAVYDSASNYLGLAPFGCI